MKEFEPGLPTFRLRWDLPLEIGMVDKIRAPLSASDFSRIQAERPELASLSLEAYNEQRRSYGRPTLPPFFGLFAAVGPRTKELSCWIVDGSHTFRIGEGPHAAGTKALWDHVLFRLAAAHSWPSESRPLIYPNIPACEHNHWTYPAKMLVLFTGDGVAAAVPWERGEKYLNFNQPERQA